MKIGVKIHPDNPGYLKDIKNYIDFIELVAIEGKSYNFLKSNQLPVIIHSEDFNYQANLVNADNNVVNKRYLEFLIDMVKKFKAPYIILNPGIKINNRCTVQNLSALLKKEYVKKVIIENQPALKNKTYPFFGRNYDEIQAILKQAGIGFCFDFAHAFASAFYFEKEPLRFCMDILELRPRHIHISNGRSMSFLDLHLHFTKGDFDMGKLKELIPKDAWVTVDTTNDLLEQLEEIAFLRGEQKSG
ncbi:MAG: TIM barrel protein [Nanoarchaeota archaeon]